MTLWDELVQQLQPSVIDQLRSNYGELFPIEIRQYLADWLENRLLHTVPDNEQSIECVKFFEEFLTELKTKAEEMVATKLPESLHLSNAARNLRQVYAHDNLQLYKHLRQCLQYEANLLRNPRLYSPRLTDDGEILQALETLLLKAREIESENRLLKQDFEVFSLKYYDVSKFNAESVCWLQQRPDMRENIEKARSENNLKLHNLHSNLMGKKAGLIEKFRSVILEVDAIQQTVLGKYLSEWLMSQKIIVMGGCIKPNSIKLDTIQKMCENLAQILWIIREQGKNLIVSSQQVQQISDQSMMHDYLPEILNNVTKLLESLIIRSFVIEKQPPQVIGIKKKFESTVRLLIGNKLNINMDNPQVTARIISERQAREIQVTNQCNESCGNIINNIGFMEYNETTNHLALSLNHLLLPSMPKEMSKIRKERTGTESVADKKFALLFQSNFSIGNGDMAYSVWALSLPIVVTSHTNQKPEAWATIFWDNAFSDFNREPFVVHDKVPVTSFANALNMRFRSKTNRSLTDENLHFLCEKATRMKLPMPLTDACEVSWTLFCKDMLPNRDFSFWIWFYKTLKLTKKRIIGPWSDGLIEGFINKENAEAKLLQCQNGTFLLRFAESELGGVTIALMQNNFVTHIEPFTEKVLEIRSLADSIRDLDNMVYLYPNKPTREAFERHMTPRQINVKGNYVKSELRMALRTSAMNSQTQSGYEGFQINMDDNQQNMDFSLSLPNFDVSFMSPNSYQIFTTSY